MLQRCHRALFMNALNCYENLGQRTRLQKTVVKRHRKRKSENPGQTIILYYCGEAVNG